MATEIFSRVKEPAVRASQLKSIGCSGGPPDSDPGSTELMMRRVQRGDMEAFEEIIRRYRRKVYRVIRSHTRDSEDAMEVLQVTFLIRRFIRGCPRAATSEAEALPGHRAAGS